MRGKPRDQHINVRVTSEERAAIMARSSSYRMTPSAFMREASLHCDEKPVRVADAEVLVALRTDLKRLGNLLNQLARSSHMGTLDESALPVLRSTLRGVSNAASQISSLLTEANRRK